MNPETIVRGAVSECRFNVAVFSSHLFLFGIHIYLLPIDKAFPLMMVNGIVWWFLVDQHHRLSVLQGLVQKTYRETGLTLYDLGISFSRKRFTLGGGRLARTFVLALVLGGFAYLCEHTLERIFIVDWRFIFPFASDLTPYRFRLVAGVFPMAADRFCAAGNISAWPHAARLAPALVYELRSPRRPLTLLVLIVPLVVFLMVQYVPLLSGGSVPLVGPGGMFIAFTHNLIHVVLVLMLVVPLSTWFYQLSRKVYLGAIISAALVAWMFASSQVVAPIPV